MEFERVIFRVHDATVQTLVRNRRRCKIQPQSACRLLSEVLFLSMMLLAFISSSLHTDLETGECLVPGFERALRVDEFGAPALSDVANSTDWRLSRDTIVQLRIVHNTITNDADVIFASEEDDADADAAWGSSSSLRRSLLRNESKNVTRAPHVQRSVNVDYTITRTPALLYLEDSFLDAHRVRRVNVTVHSDCLSKKSKLHDWMHDRILGFDTPIVNQVMFALGRGGLVRSEANGEVFRWSSSLVRFRIRAKNLKDFAGSREWFFSRVWVVLKSCLVFFLISALTSVVIRVLMTSGVVVVFGAWYVLQLLGVPTYDFARLAMGYPWLGAPLQLLRQQHEAAAPLMTSHLLRVAVTYVAYEASQTTLAAWFYGATGTLPASVPVAILGLELGWEYAVMLFMRSLPSITLVPKLTALYFIGMHFVLFSRARPYAMLNVLICAIAIVHALLYALLKFEVPALSRGDISAEKPRAAFTTLPWPALDAMLPPSWTLFMPPTFTEDSLEPNLLRPTPAQQVRRDPPPPVVEDDPPDHNPLRHQPLPQADEEDENDNPAGTQEGDVLVALDGDDDDDGDLEQPHQRTTTTTEDSAANGASS